MSGSLATPTRIPRARVTPRPARDLIDLTAGMGFASRHRLAWRDVADSLRFWHLAWHQGWLDIRLRYRGSVLGPLWLTLSTGVMVGALGFLYSTLFTMDLRQYLPFLALSLVLWGFLQAAVQDACATFTQAEGLIRSVRLPFFVQAARVLIRNVLALGHNIIVIVVVFAIFGAWPGGRALLALPGATLWCIDTLACCALLGPICARFRDVPPIIGSALQIAFFVSAIIWKPEQIGGEPVWLRLNPFFALIEIVRAPLLGRVPDPLTYASAVGWSVLLCGVAWFLFARARGRIAFWV